MIKGNRMGVINRIHHRNLSAIAGSILAVLIGAGPARAYTTRMDDECAKILHWPPGKEVPYWINKKCSDDLPFERCEAAIKAAFDTVQNISCTGIVFKYMGTTDADQYRHFPADANDGINLITWYETWPPDADTSDIAVASFWSLRNYQGEFIEFGVALNGADYKWADDLSSDAHDIQGVITTQVLYLLGLWHSDSDQSILDGRYAYGSGLKRTPLQDDIDGVCFLAPKNPAPDHWDTACPADQHCENAECVPGAPPAAPDSGETPDGASIQPGEGGKTPAKEAGSATLPEAGSARDAAAGIDGSTAASGSDGGRTAECVFNADCRDDQVCLNARCVAPEKGDAGGCGCKVSQGGPRLPLGSLLFLIFLGLYRIARRKTMG